MNTDQNAGRQEIAIAAQKTLAMLGPDLTAGNKELTECWQEAAPETFKEIEAKGFFKGYRAVFYDGTTMKRMVQELVTKIKLDLGEHVVYLRNTPKLSRLSGPVSYVFGNAVGGLVESFKEATDVDMSMVRLNSPYMIVVYVAKANLVFITAE